LVFVTCNCPSGCWRRRHEEICVENLIKFKSRWRFVVHVTCISQVFHWWAPIFFSCWHFAVHTRVSLEGWKLLLEEALWQKTKGTFGPFGRVRQWVCERSFFRFLCVWCVKKKRRRRGPAAWRFRQHFFERDKSLLLVSLVFSHNM
jgi:hypothetical protein